MTAKLIAGIHIHVAVCKVNLCAVYSIVHMTSIHSAYSHPTVYVLINSYFE